ncbi:MAG: DEAD/DEAH box helicase [Candidatus Woesearchaeota archaeon]|nr:DEAD/DEAH box helicase [Candidatus Woesearchaeota archaeon]
MTKFTDIMDDAALLQAIDDMGFDTPTPIQEATVPPALEGLDIIGQAKTGSGKTFAFGIPILHSLDDSKSIQALVIAPTRELAQQISRELKKLAKYTYAKICTVYGGVGMQKQIDELKKADIVVGTPGRLCDHLGRNTMNLSRAKTFVLDEADRMFDMGFIEDIEKLMEALPEQRQTLLFSATMPTPIKNLASKYMYEPEHIKTQSHVEEVLLPQIYYVIEHNRKFSLLYHVIKEEEFEKGIIFCGTRRTVDAVSRNLRDMRMRADCLHGGMSQAQRTRIMNDFRHGKIHLLIATDVAARGLDINDVTHVINYDVPNNPEDYIHRIGRTARAGASGKAITLLEERDFDAFRSVLSIVPSEPEEGEVGDIKSVSFRSRPPERHGRYQRGKGRGQGGYRGRGPRRSGGPRRGGRSGGGKPRRR